MVGETENRSIVQPFSSEAVGEPSTKIFFELSKALTYGRTSFAQRVGVDVGVRRPLPAEFGARRRLLSFLTKSRKIEESRVRPGSTSLLLGLRFPSICLCCNSDSRLSALPHRSF